MSRYPKLSDLFLFEASFQEKDIPNVFWLVTNISKEEWGQQKTEQIASGELKGLKGISGNKEIVMSWFTIARNAVLVMPSKQVVSMNDLSRVMYDNPHYLVSKNMIALYRIWNKEFSELGHTGVIQNLMDYIKAVGKKTYASNSKIMNSVLYLIDYGTFSAYEYANHFKENLPKINSIKDLAEWLKNTTVIVSNDNRKDLLEEVKTITTKEWLGLLIPALKNIGKIYESEGEWFVKNDTFKIPEKSILFIALSDNPKNINPEIKEKYLSGEKVSHFDLDYNQRSALDTVSVVEKYGLNKRYKVNYVSVKKYEEIRSKLFTKRSREKYNV